MYPYSTILEYIVYISRDPVYNNPGGIGPPAVYDGHSGKGKAKTKLSADMSAAMGGRGVSPMSAEKFEQII